MKRGKFIVIDGSDGSGKATQVSLLAYKLTKEKKKVKVIDFPQYEKNFFGKNIGKCLAGEYGDFISIDPHIVSVLYAADRWESSKKINKWLKEDYVVIADRYASANQIHQGGKIKNKKKREEFLKWLEKMEFEIFRIPKPDMILFLDVPIDISQKLLSKMSKKYLNGEKDLAETNRKHLMESKNNAVYLVKKMNNWIKINCVKNDKLMSKEKISELVWDKVKKII